jgi:hypothetical protein
MHLPTTGFQRKQISLPRKTSWSIFESTVIVTPLYRHWPSDGKANVSPFKKIGTFFG